MTTGTTSSTHPTFGAQKVTARCMLQATKYPARNPTTKVRQFTHDFKPRIPIPITRRRKTMNGLRNLSWLNPTPEVLERALTVARDNAVDAALNALLPPPPPTADTLLTEPVLEVGISTFRGYTEWFPVVEPVWLAWTGLRRRDGEDYHGPVRPMDQPSVTYSGPRECGCRGCQATVAPLDRLN